MIIIKVCFVLIFLISFSKTDNCNLPNELVTEIRGYKDTVNKIIDAVTNGKYKGQTYKELATFVDKFGARQAGSDVLEDSIDYLLELLPSKGYDLESVHGENVTIPHWVR